MYMYVPYFLKISQQQDFISRPCLMKWQFEGSVYKEWHARMYKLSFNNWSSKSTYPARTEALHLHYIIVQLGRMMPTTFTNTKPCSRVQEQKLITCITHSTAGTVDGCGYDGQLKCTTCDAYNKLCHSILSILKPVFCQIQHICCAYNSLWCLDLHIWRFLCPRQRQ